MITDENGEMVSAGSGSSALSIASGGGGSTSTSTSSQTTSTTSISSSASSAAAMTASAMGMAMMNSIPGQGCEIDGTFYMDGMQVRRKLSSTGLHFILKLLYFCIISLWTSTEAPIRFC